MQNAPKGHGAGLIPAKLVNIAVRWLECGIPDIWRKQRLVSRGWSPGMAPARYKPPPQELQRLNKLLPAHACCRPTLSSATGTYTQRNENLFLTITNKKFWFSIIHSLLPALVFQVQHHSWNNSFIYYTYYSTSQSHISNANHISPVPFVLIP